MLFVARIELQQSSFCVCRGLESVRWESVGEMRSCCCGRAKHCYWWCHSKWPMFLMFCCLVFGGFRVLGGAQCFSGISTGRKWSPVLWKTCTWVVSWGRNWSPGLLQGGICLLKGTPWTRWQGSCCGRWRDKRKLDVFTCPTARKGQNFL